MISQVKSKIEVIQSEIKLGLKKIRFYPMPETIAFTKLPLKVQEEARAYWEQEQDRVDRLMQEYEQGEW